MDCCTLAIECVDSIIHSEHALLYFHAVTILLITFSLLFPILLFYFLCAYPLLFIFFYIFFLLSHTQACSPKKVGRQTLDYMKGQEKLTQWIISYKKVRGRRPRLTASLRIKIGRAHVCTP